MGKFTKADLKTGMFGKCNGDLFVVAGDKLIYEKGLYDDIEDMNDNLEFGFGCNIDELYEAKCFEAIHDGNCVTIWKREEKKPEATPEATPEAPKAVEGAITLTEDQFFEAVQKANEKYMEIGSNAPTKDIPGHELLDAMMGMQNILFGELIGCVLFNKEIK